MDSLDHTPFSFDFTYDFEDDFDFETDSCVHEQGDFLHDTLSSKGCLNATNKGANLAILFTSSSTAQPVAGTVNESTTPFTEEWPDNGTSFLVEQCINHLEMNYSTPVQPHMSQQSAESAPTVPSEKLCPKCHNATTVQEAPHTPIGMIITPSSPSSASDSTTTSESSTSFSCQLPSCKHWNKRFKTKGDFARHQLLHRPPRFTCPKDFCTRSRRGFHRKDKLISHLERGHYESKQQAKMLACEQEMAVNVGVMDGVRWDFGARICAVDWHDSESC